MTGALKRTAEWALVRSGAYRVGRAAKRGRTLLLAYHNIVPDGKPAFGDVPLHLAQKSFGEQLDLLCATHDVVPLDVVLRVERSTGRPRVAITFDDAYTGAVTAGVLEVVKRDLPATIFVAPGCLGSRSFWWDALQEPGRNGQPGVLRRRALEEFGGRDDTIREWAAASGMIARDVPDHVRPADAEMLRRALEHAGITLGAHGWSHADLTRLPDGELQEELRRSIDWLRNRFNAFIPWIAYPYGLSSTAVQRAAADAGYRAGVTAGGGWLTRRPPDVYALPRYNVPSGMSLDGFALRSAGILCR